MSRLLRALRRFFLLWFAPGLVLLLVLVTGFLAWGVGTEAGTRWVLTTAVQQFGGQAQGVSGSIWRGIRVRNLEVSVPTVALRAQDLYLQVDWRELRERRLRAKDLSVGVLDLDIIQSADEPAPSTPFSMPVLPVQVALDRVSLGALNVTLNKEPLLLNVQNLQASLAVSNSDAQLVFRSLRLGSRGIDADIEGQLNLLALSQPWPLSAHLKTQARSREADSLLCIRHFLPTLPAQAAPKSTPLELSKLSAACALDVDTVITGSLNALDVKVAGSGQDIHFNVNAGLAPIADFPLRTADVAVQLSDGSSLNGKLNWDVATADNASHDHVTGSLQANKLNLGLLLDSVVPDAMVTAALDFDAQLLNHKDLLSANLGLQLGSGSRWNKQALSGALKASVINTLATASNDAPPAGGEALWHGLQLADLDMDLRLGKNQLQGKGALGSANSKLNLKVAAARLADFWPGLPGGVQAQAQLGGSLAAHTAQLKAVYTDGSAPSGQLGSGPTELQANMAGGWGKTTAAADSPEGWRGTLAQLQLKHAGLRLNSQKPVAIMFTPGAPSVSGNAATPPWIWQVGAASIELLLPSGKGVVVRHTLTHVGTGRWETQGAIDKLVMSRSVLAEIEGLAGLSDGQPAKRGGVIVKLDKKNDQVEIAYGLNWDLHFAGALAGKARITRLSGDLIVPGEPDFPLGLQTFNVDLTATPLNASSSRINADINIATAKMGQASAKAAAVLHATPTGGFALKDSDPKTVSVNADIADLSWLSLFVGDAMDIGGSLKADVQAQSRANGTWATSGTVSGQGIRLVRIDDGVRLLDGTLAAHFEDSRFVLDSLRFPARLRVAPKEWRTQEWVSTNADAKDGSLTLTGSWDLYESVGGVDIELYRYPILQRSDRYAMVTGKLKVSAPIPKLSISGQLTADAGWIDLDMLSSVPTVDGDVVVIRPGQVQKASTPIDVTLDLEVNLGPRFYITGYGVDSGLTGAMHIRMLNDKLTASGALRTRGGAINIYGQHLQLRRGSITFQGDITSPILNIEALRTGVAVEAGVRVAGTAKRPRIDLVSYPDVSDVQKLSWLLLGRGPDDSGGDAALLFSVGTSFLGDGEPFYRKFGLDEVAMRTGELGSTGSILPVESVVRGLDSGTSDIERKFVVASKKLSNGITLSIEQALSDTGTVGRATYQLARGLSAEFSVGTVTGLALIYRIVSRN